MLFHLNERLNQLNGQENQMGFPKFKLPKLAPPKPDTGNFQSSCRCAKKVKQLETASHAVSVMRVGPSV